MFDRGGNSPAQYYLSSQIFSFQVYTRRSLICIHIIKGYLGLSRSLKNMPLGLFDANNPDVSPHDHCYNANGPDRGTRNQYHPLRIPVGVLNRDASRRTYLI